MNLTTRFRHALGILAGQKSAVIAVAANPRVLPGLVFLVVSYFVGTLPWGLVPAILAAFASPIFFSFGAGVAFLLTKLFGGTGTYMALWRALSHASILNSLGLLLFIPYVNSVLWILISVYEIVLTVLILETTQDIRRLKAIAVVLIPVGFSLLGFFLLFTHGSALAPFIYTLF